MTPSTPSSRPVRLIAGASRHPGRNRARPAAIIALSFSIASWFSPSTTRRPSSHSLLIPVSFLISFYLVSKGVSFLYRIVY